jgi:hypothetical protein
MSYGQRPCTAEFTPALGQIKGYSIANLFEAICCCKASHDLDRDPSGHPAGSGLNWEMSRHSFVYPPSSDHWFSL